MLILGSDELSVLTNEVVSGVESITKALSKLGEYHLLLGSTSQYVVKSSDECHYCSKVR